MSVSVNEVIHVTEEYFAFDYSSKFDLVNKSLIDLNESVDKLINLLDLLLSRLNGCFDLLLALIVSVIFGWVVYRGLSYFR